MPSRPSRPGLVRAAVCSLLLLLAATACSDDESGAPSTTTAAPGGGSGKGDHPTIDLDSAPALGEDDATIVGGTQEITVTGLEAKSEVHVIEADGTVRVTLVADDAGQAHLAYLPTEYLSIETGGKNIIPTDEGESLQAQPYRVGVGSLDDPSKVKVSEEFRVRGIDDHPEAAFYDDTVLEGTELGILGGVKEGSTVDGGFQYLEMRDGVTLSAMVRFPDTDLYGEGPWPTIVELEGYSASNPDGEPPGARIARSFGYATVAVNIRGTGCSGGVFDVFNPSQQVDGYDVVEHVARQDWVLHNQVGVLGLSYSGIMTMYTAAANPPHLAAAIPQSIIVDPWIQQWPGGIYNGGFTKQWLEERDRQNAVGGDSWVNARIDGGDATCEENLSLRTQNIDFESFGRVLADRPEQAAERDLRELARKIEAPVLLTGAFQDEQTGPLFTTMLNNFDNAHILRVGMWNGRHPDGYTPMNIMRWFEFMELYVAERVPQLNPLVRSGGEPEFAKTFGLTDITLPPDRLFERFGDDYAAALEFFEAEDPIRIVFENGRGGDEDGEPGGSFEQTFASWPPPAGETMELFLGEDGALTDDVPSDEGVDTYQFDPAAGAEDFFKATDDGGSGYDLFAPLWSFDWTEFAEGRQLSYLTEPMADDVVLAGPGNVRLWVSSDEADADVQVTISEVRPDGVEYELQNGWLRISRRLEDETHSDGLYREHTFAKADQAEIPEGAFVEARIGLPSVAAPIRAGSRLRLQIASPGRNHGTWLFENPYDDGVEPWYRIARGGERPSSLSLTVVSGLEVPAGLAPCPGLRGQACRTYVEVANLAAEAVASATTED